MVDPDAPFAQQLFEAGGIGTKITQAWKLGKVALNPPSQVRNIVSNHQPTAPLGRADVAHPGEADSGHRRDAIRGALVAHRAEVRHRRGQLQQQRIA
jgi:hypothetical protein